MDDFETMYELAASENLYLCVGTGLVVVSALINLGLQERFGGLVDALTTPSGGGVSSSTPEATLSAACWAILAIYALLSIVSFAQYYLLEMAADRIKSRLRVRVFSCLLDQPLKFFDRHGAGSLLSILSEDAAVLADATTKQLATGLGSIFTLFLALYHMFSVSPPLSRLALGIVTPLAGISLLLALGLRNLRAQVAERVASSLQFAGERLSAIPTVRAFNSAPREVSTFSRAVEWVDQLKFRVTLLHAAFHSGVEIGNGLLVGGVMFWGGKSLLEGQLSPGSLMTFLLYARGVASSLRGMSLFHSSLSKGLVAAGRIQEVIEPEEEENLVLSSQLLLTPDSSSLRGGVRFHAVTFAYPSRPGVRVLDEVNLDIPAGASFAIFGASGSGKSTLAALLLRLYEIKEGDGSIKLDGLNISSLDPIWLRSQIGYVPQDPILFSGSIRSNILYGVDHTPSQTTPTSSSSGSEVDSLLYKAALDANALEFISRLPHQFETLVGERGEWLSGGQRQRIAIARALVKNPKILLFDEATSALDGENERLVQEALERVGRGRTLIIIAHRLSTVRHADRIGVISDGKVVEVGSYEDLMAIPFGKFKRLSTGGGVI